MNTGYKVPTGLETQVYRWVAARLQDLNVKVNAVGNCTPNYNWVYDRLVVINTEIPKPFRREDIKSALNMAIEELKKTQFLEIRNHLDSNESFDRNIHEKLVSLMKLASIDDNDDGYTSEECALLMEKVIWQFKRKIHDLPVSNHMMLVFVGKQGGGKSQLVRSFTSPVKELTVNTNIKNVCDDRNIDIFNYYIAFFDELEKANRVDVEDIKNLITADTMARRPMRSNNTQNVKQNLTCIGATNKSVAAMIVDETGNRRFGEINIIPPDHPNIKRFWDAVNSFDWLSLWRSVGHNHPDPTENIKIRIIDQQLKTRTKSLTEYWIENLIEEDSRFLSGKMISTKDLYEDYRRWEDGNGGNYKTTIRQFEVNFKDLSRQEIIPFEYKKTSSTRGYCYTG